MEILGNIYKITNQINGMSYIGQTTQSIQSRFIEHKSDSKRLNTRIHVAMRRYGIDNFTIELLERCPINKLNEREIFYIDKYDTYLNGYNSTLGGGFDNNKRISVEDNDLDNIISLYKSGYSTLSIANNYNIDKKVVNNLLRACNIEIRHQKTINLNQEETEEIISKYKLGASLKFLSKEYGFSSSTIKRFLLEHGVEVISKDFILQDKERCNQVLNDFENTDLKYKDIMNKYSICFSTLKKIIGDRKRKYRLKLRTFTKEQEKEIIELYFNNKRIKTIAKKYNVDFNTIKRVLQRNNILETV